MLIASETFLFLYCGRFSDLEDASTDLIEDDSYNGAAMRVTKALGRDVATFKEIPLQ